MNMVKVKALLAKIATWISAPESIAGSGFKWNVYGNPVHKRTTDTDTYSLVANDGSTNHHKFYWEKGQQEIFDSTGEVSVRCKRTDSGKAGDVLLMVGSGGDNHGVYSRHLDKWIVHAGTNSYGFANSAVTADTSGNVTISKKVTVGALGNGIFVTDAFDISVSVSSANSNVANSVTRTKAGYYPLCIDGYAVATGGAYSRGVIMTAQSSGSATVSARLYATSTGNKTVNVRMLWVKITA